MPPCLLLSSGRRRPAATSAWDGTVSVFAPFVWHFAAGWRRLQWRQTKDSLCSAADWSGRTADAAALPTPSPLLDRKTLLSSGGQLQLDVAAIERARARADAMGLPQAHRDSHIVESSGDVVDHISAAMRSHCGHRQRCLLFRKGLLHGLPALLQSVTGVLTPAEGGCAAADAAPQNKDSNMTCERSLRREIVGKRCIYWKEKQIMRFEIEIQSIPLLSDTVLVSGRGEINMNHG